ncbi:MAG: alginate lyase family protein, partial [Chitinophagaceae bacterium]
MKSRLLSMLLIMLSYVLPAQLPRVFILDANHMAELRLKAVTKEKGILDHLDSLKKEADHFLKMKPVSVMDKNIIPPSGDKHDYMSQAPYFWYDSSKPNGLPYLRKDGVRNPEINKITDHVTMDKMQESTRILSLAWYLFGEQKYAAKCASLIRTCFLDKATKMNPNLDYGQGIPGINTGRGIGIIETRS